MKFLIYPNVTRPEAVQSADALTELLTSKGHTCVRSGENLNDCSMAIVIGGDGTVLRAIRETYACGFPYWAVNYGHLGYLTECQPEEAPAMLELITAGHYHVEQRCTMHGQLLRNGNATSFFGLNEAVIHRGGYTRTLRMSLAVSGNEIMRLSGDGLLVATPTGSTAYNLSAGGPILMPDAEHLVITPICPHASICAPIVVSRKHRISVTVDIPPADQDAQMPQLVIDGLQPLPLRSGDVVECSVSPVSIGFVKTSDVSFYRRLQQRMAHEVI